MQESSREKTQVLEKIRQSPLPEEMKKLLETYVRCRKIAEKKSLEEKIFHGLQNFEMQAKQFLEIKNYILAEAFYQRMLVIAEVVNKPAFFWLVYEGQGHCAEAQEKWLDAIAFYQKALNSREKEQGLKHQDVLDAYRKLQTLCIQAGEYSLSFDYDKKYQKHAPQKKAPAPVRERDRALQSLHDDSSQFRFDNREHKYIKPLKKLPTVNEFLTTCQQQWQMAGDNLNSTLLLNQCRELDIILAHVLPECWRNFSVTQGESLSAILAIFILSSALSEQKTLLQHSTVTVFQQKANDLQQQLLPLLQFKGKQVYWIAWLKEWYAPLSAFDWQKHVEAQNESAEIAALSETEALVLLKDDRFFEIKSTLQQMAQQAFIFKELKKAIDYNQKTNIILQLEKMGDVFQQQALTLRENKAEPSYWKDTLIYSVMFYHAALMVLQKNIAQELSEEEKAQKSKILWQKIKAIETDFLQQFSAIQKTACPVDDEMARRKALAEKRAAIKNELHKMQDMPADDDEQAYARAAILREIAKENVDNVKAFIADVFAETIKDFGEPPCQYALIGFGSMEKQACTLYSDVEFGILLEEGKDTPENRQYFRDLTYLFHLKVIHLGETPIPFSLFNYSFDRLTGMGFCFDLGGKISLGRRYEEVDKPNSERYCQIKYELIGDSQTYINYASDAYFKVDKFLPVEVARCTHICGNPEITHHYHQKLDEKFSAQDEQGCSLYQRRAMELFLGNQYLKSDLAEHEPKIGEEKEGQLYDVKKEIYRLPDRLIDNLSFFYGIHAESAWDKLAELQRLKVINETTCKNLRIIDGIANELRLQTYAYYNRQQEKLSVTPKLFEDGDTLFRLTETKLLERFYATVCPFHQRLKFFAASYKKNEPAESLLLQEDFLDKSLYTQSKVYQRLGKYEEAYACLQQFLQELEIEPENFQIEIVNPQHNAVRDEKIREFLKAATLASLACTCDAKGRIEEAKNYWQRLLKWAKNHYGKDHVQTANTLGNLANAYGRLGDVAQKKMLLERALHIFEAHYGKDHVKTANTLGNLANAYGALGDVAQKKMLLECALRIFEAHYGKDHVQTANTLGNLANAYGTLGDVAQAKMLLERTLRSEEAHYGKDHVQTAMTLNNLAMAYGDLGDVAQKKMLLECALHIEEAHYGKEHMQTASTLNNLGAVYHVLGEMAQAKNYWERSLRIFEAHYGKDHVQTASTLNNLATAYGALGDVAQKKMLLERALRIFEAYYGKDHVQTATTLHNLGMAYGTLGDVAQAKMLLERALRIFEAHYGKDHVQTAMTLMNLVTAYAALGDVAQQKMLLERALRIKEAHYGKDHVETATTLNNLAMAYGALGDTAQSKNYCERALRIKEAHYGKDHVQTAHTLHNLADAYGALGDVAQKKILLERTLRIQEAHYGKDHVQTADTLVCMGTVYYALGEIAQAKNYWERALRIQEAHYGKDHVRTANTLVNLGNNYYVLGEIAQAKNYWERALRIFEAHYGKDHVQTANTLMNLATAYGALGDVAQKKMLLERALRIQEAHYGKDHVETASTLVSMGTVYQALGEIAQAKNYWERALRIEEAHYGKDHVETATTLNNLAMAYGELGDVAQKKMLLERTLRIFEAHYGKDHVQTAHTLHNLATAYDGALGDTAQSKNYCERALRIQEAHYGKNHAQTEKTRQVYEMLLQIEQIEEMIKTAKTSRSQISPYLSQALFPPAIENTDKNNLQFSADAHQWLSVYVTDVGGAPLTRIDDTTLTISIQGTDIENIKPGLLEEFVGHIKTAVGENNYLCHQTDGATLTMQFTNKNITDSLVALLQRIGFQLSVPEKQKAMSLT